MGGDYVIGWDGPLTGRFVVQAHHHPVCSATLSHIVPHYWARRQNVVAGTIAHVHALAFFTTSSGVA